MERAEVPGTGAALWVVAGAMREIADRRRGPRVRRKVPKTDLPFAPGVCGARGFFGGLCRRERIPQSAFRTVATPFSSSQSFALC